MSRFSFPLAALGLLLSLALETSAQQSQRGTQPAPITELRAESLPPGVTEPAQVCAEGACILTYEAAFFQRYAPVTALDMVNNLPGFRLDNGDSDTRGFGGAAGNVIINGARISAKSETPENILGRIPAADVLRIEVIRGQVGGLDLRGQNVVANVIRTGDTASGAWTAGASSFDPGGGVYPFGELSYSVSPDRGQLTVALAASESKDIVARRERVLDADGNLQESRFELSDEDEEEYSIAVNANTQRGDTSYAVNLAWNYESNDGGENSRRYPESDAPFLLFNSADYLEIAVADGDAASRLGLGVGDQSTLSLD